MMNFALSSLMFLIAFAWQDLDFFTIVERFGFPTALFVLTFVYFQGQLRATDKQTNEYRAQTIEILRQQLDIAQQQNARVKQTNVILESQNK